MFINLKSCFTFILLHYVQKKFFFMIFFSSHLNIHQSESILYINIKKIIRGHSSMHPESWGAPCPFSRRCVCVCVWLQEMMFYVSQASYGIQSGFLKEHMKCSCGLLNLW